MKALHHVDLADSTNDLAYSLAERGAIDGTLVLADAQDAGRGRRGRDWFSPAKGNVYLSYIHRSSLAPAALSALTLDVASALASALEDMTGLRAELKWPNDLLIKGRKIAGILTELHTDISASGDPVVIIGVGVNVAMAEADFPDALKAIATSIQMETGQSFSSRDLAELIGRRIGEKMAGYEAGKGPDMVAYMARFPFVGTRVIHEGQREGVIEGVGEDGSLTITWQDTQERESLWSGEITFLMPEGEPS